MRSLLFVPADSPRKLEKSLQTEADILLIDLENSVAPSNKVRARAIAAEFLADQPQSGRFFVRLNALDTPWIEDDLGAILQSRPRGVMLPKSASGADIDDLSNRLEVHEAEAGLAAGSTRVLAIATESAASIFGLKSYSPANPRLDGLAWGSEDLSADIGAPTNRRSDGQFTDPFALARNLCLFAAVAAETAPIDTVYTDFRDSDGLRREATSAQRDGFTAKMAIHPDQVEPINTVFTPTIEAIEEARAILAAFENASDAGVISLDGRMYDRPHIKRAEKLLARWPDSRAG